MSDVQLDKLKLKSEQAEAEARAQKLFDEA